VGHPQVQQARATIHLAKPFANRDLVQAVQQALGRNLISRRTLLA